MNIYLAGKWEERNLINNYGTKLESLGHKITWPWFRVETEDSDPSEAACADLQGIRESETCIFIFERDLRYNGAMSELGMALALNKRIIVVGSGGDHNIFMNLPPIEKVKYFSEAITLLQLPVDRGVSQPR